MANQTAKEQELLELINRMRTNPEAELQILLGSSDKDIQAALSFFKVDLNTLKTQWSKLVKAAPLAWSGELNQAAAGHNDAMITANVQSHQVGSELDLGGRLKAAGYNFNSASENVYAYGKSLDHSHAGFAIDWGSTPTGIQNPTGHRNSIMDKNLREVGISVADSKAKPGELVITQNFGNRSALAKKGWLLGVAFQDTDRDNRYDAGEGLKDVQVKITDAKGISKTTTVGDAGGYQELLDPGQYQIDFIRNGEVVQSKTAAIDAAAPDNVKLDLVIPVVALTNTPTPQPSVSGAVAPATVAPLSESVSASSPESETSAPTPDFAGAIAGAPERNYANLNQDVATIEPVNGKSSYRLGDGYLATALRQNQESDKDEHLHDGSAHESYQDGYIYAPFVGTDGNKLQMSNSENFAFNLPDYVDDLLAGIKGIEQIQSLADRIDFGDVFSSSDIDRALFHFNPQIATRSK